MTLLDLKAERVVVRFREQNHDCVHILYVYPNRTAREDIAELPKHLNVKWPNYSHDNTQAWFNKQLALQQASKAAGMQLDI